MTIFSSKNIKTLQQGRNECIKLIKQDELLFRRMLVACQNREPVMVEFFSHENQPFPPALSQAGKLRKTTKSDLLKILENSSLDCDECQETLRQNSVLQKRKKIS